MVILTAYSLDLLVATLMTFFLKFHLYLVNANKTTIENLDKQKRNAKSIYDMASTVNWQQVFGRNKALWPFPVFCGAGKPVGDGIYWPTNVKQEEESQSHPNTD